MHNQVGGTFLLSKLQEKVRSVRYCLGRQLFIALQREEEKRRERERREWREKGVFRREEV